MCVCRPLREELYRAFITRASSGETDNTPLIEKTLGLRQEQAELLGYPNYAEVSLASKVGLSDRPPYSVSPARQSQIRHHPPDQRRSKIWLLCSNTTHRTTALTFLASFVHSL